MTAYGTSLGRYADGHRDLKARIDRLVLERVEAAIQTACLNALVEQRRRLGQALPSEDNADDRRALEQLVHALLERLEARMLPTLSPEQQAGIAASPDPAKTAGQGLARQASLAKLLPDYWRHFEDCRLELETRQAAEPPQRPGLLGRIFSGS